MLSVNNTDKLAFIYSTSLSRSVELLNAVKRLIRWTETSRMPAGIDPPSVVRDIETAIVVECCGLRNVRLDLWILSTCFVLLILAQKGAVARPKGIEGNRGQS